MLAVFTTQTGASFIDRHVNDVLPGQTVVVAKWKAMSPSGEQRPNVPGLYLDEWRRRLDVRLARRAGVNGEKQREAAIAKFLARHRVTVALGEYLDEFVEFVPLLDRLGIPYVVQSHGMDASARLRDPKTAESYLAFRSARAVLTRSELHRQRLIALGLPAAKVHVSIGGIDVPAQPPKRGPEASRRFLAIGFMTPKKSPIYLLESFRRALAEDPGLTLDYVGGGPLQPAAKHFVDACGLSDQVRLHGVAPEAVKQRLLRECGIFVQHSLTDRDTGDEEGLPASIQEAMANGMAVVSTRHAGIPEAIEDGISGLLVAEGDVKAMAQAMLRIIPLARQIGPANHPRAAARHAWRFERARLLAALGLDEALGADAA